MKTNSRLALVFAIAIGFSIAERPTAGADDVPQREDKPGKIRDDNGLKMKFAYIPAGEFMMGSPETEKDRSANEKQHRVRITHGFYLGVYAVTQAEYERMIGKNPSWFATRGGGKDNVAGLDISRFPVESVSWDDAMEFCRKFTESERQAGRLPAGWKYTLPTEAQWEYACRAGTTTRFNVGDTISTKDANIWISSKEPNPLYRTTSVGSYKPNAWGLYDMHGNVWQWCADWYDKDYYDNSPAKDPSGPANGADRVLRGGSWLGIGPVVDGRSADHRGGNPLIRSTLMGFRVARVPSSE
jgi:formylglycine-generating enzyme required for sulfatase activity